MEEFKKAMNSLSNINSKSTGISFNFPDFDTDDVNFVKTLTEKKLLDRSIGIKDPSPEMITALMTRNVIDEETGEVLDTHYSPFLTLPRLENLSKESATKLLEYTNLLKGKYP
ncbi:hypothetical protein IJM86_04380 [bacterium]|nr:hypothetical protein [bacterium]